MLYRRKKTISETGIKNMRKFYETWMPVLNRQLSVADLEKPLNINELLNRQLMVADLNEDDFKCFLSVGFTHHRKNKNEDIEELKKLMN